MPPDCRKEGLIFKKFLEMAPQIPPPPPPPPPSNAPYPPLGGDTPPTPSLYMA